MFFSKRIKRLEQRIGSMEEQPKPSAETGLRERIKLLEQENAMLEAENAKLCAKIEAIRRAAD